MEDYKEIPSCPGYYINTVGLIISKKGRTSRLLRTFKTKSGSHIVMLSNNGGIRSYYIPRLILETFRGFPAEPHLCYVRYLDGNVDNCVLENLEWEICETNEDYDPTKSKRRGILKPSYTKDKIKESKKNHLQNSNPDQPVVDKNDERIKKLIAEKIKEMKRKYGIE